MLPSAHALKGFCFAQMLASGVLARALSRMRAAGAGSAHSLASSIVLSVFFIVSFVFVSIIVIIISEHTVQWWW